MSGRFNAHRECCRLRLIVGMPQALREAEYARVKGDAGPAAVAELKAKLRAELARQQQLAKAKHDAQHEREMAGGRAAAAELLRKIKDEGMHIAPRERATAGHRQAQLLETA